MERSDLDLQYSVFEGDGVRISRVVLFGHLRAATKDPHGPTPNLLIMCRDDSGCPPPWITQSAVTDQDVERLVRLLSAAGFPGRAPRIVAHKGKGRLDVTQHLAMVVELSGRRRSLNLALEHAGFSGADAEPLRAVLSRLGELAEAGGRQAVRALLEDLVWDRRCRDRASRPHPGLSLQGLNFRNACAVDGPASLALRAGTQDDDRSATPQPWSFLTTPGGCPPREARIRPPA
jgi:hypothetical protein